MKLIILAMFVLSFPIFGYASEKTKDQQISATSILRHGCLAGIEEGSSSTEGIECLKAAIDKGLNPHMPMLHARDFTCQRFSNDKYSSVCFSKVRELMNRWNY